MRQWNEKERIAVSIFQGLLLMYIVTAVILLLLALLLYKCDIGKGVVSAGIILSYVLSGLLGGFFLGKKIKVRKFFWGLVAGGTYFLVLTLVSVGLHHGWDLNVSHFILTLILCAASGMAGGMIS